MGAVKCMVFLFMVLCPAIMAGMGALQFKSTEPMALWSGQKPPRAEELTSVRAYNRLHGTLWMFFGILFIAALFLDDLFQAFDSGRPILLGIAVMMAGHWLVEKKYRKKR